MRRKVLSAEISYPAQGARCKPRSNPCIAQRAKCRARSNRARCEVRSVWAGNSGRFFAQKRPHHLQTYNSSSYLFLTCFLAASPQPFPTNQLTASRLSVSVRLSDNPYSFECVRCGFTVSQSKMQEDCLGQGGAGGLWENPGWRLGTGAQPARCFS